MNQEVKLIPLSQALHAIKKAQVELKDAKSILDKHSTAGEAQKVKDAQDSLNGLADDMEYERKRWA